ncbi:MAG: cation diffusion facilitator family transporter [Desulfurococcales archaeon]|nr:cation diffusion facilitator family transporter [Desulfurococcales archaeon]
MRGRYEKIPLLLSFLFNITAVGIKIFIYTATLSRAVFTEIFHSIGDMINSFTLYQGAVISTRPSSIRYPFGRGRFAYAASLISSVLLAGSVFYIIVIEGLLRSFDNISTLLWRSYAPLMMIIIFFDLITLLISLRIYGRVSIGGRTLLKPLILEDLMGITGNMLATISLYIENLMIDFIFSIIIAVIIVVSSTHVVYENIGVLVGVSAPKELLWKIVRHVISIPEVMDVNDVKSLALEPDEYIVILQIEINPSISLEDVLRVKEEITSIIRRIDPSIKYVIIDIVKPQEPPGTFERILREIKELKE